MANVWFVQVMGKQIGPLSDGQLKELAAKGRLTADDMVRRGQSGDWVPALRVRGLFASDGTTTETEVNSRLIACPDCSQTISMNAVSCPHCGRPMEVKKAPELRTISRTKKSRRWIGWTVAAFFILAIVGALANPGGGVSGGASHAQSASNVASLRQATLAAVNQEIYKRIRTLASAGDNVGIAALKSVGLAAHLAVGTEFRVIDYGVFTTEIKIESGPFMGQYFIVPTTSEMHP